VKLRDHEDGRCGVPAEIESDHLLTADVKRKIPSFWWVTKGQSQICPYQSCHVCPSVSDSSRAPGSVFMKFYISDTVA